MDLLELLVTLTLANFVFTAGAYRYIYRVEKRLVNKFANHLASRIKRIEGYLGIEGLDKLVDEGD